MLNFNSVMLNSDNYQKLADFYGQVFQKKPDMEEKDNGIVGYLVGTSFLSICSHDKVHGKNQNPERFILFFETNEVLDEFNRIKSITGASVVREPYSPGGSDKHKIATLADPDGNYFQLVTPWNA